MLHEAEARFSGVADRSEGYERHFGLAEPPFALTSNLRFFFESASQQAALKEIAAALPRREPILLITGATGTGKTTLCRIIAERRGPRTVVATISNPPDNVDDLLRQVLDGFGVLTEITSRVEQATHYGLLTTLQRFLGSLVALNAQAIIILDEAQHLPPALLEQIRLLSNLTAEADNHVLQIILVGQSELDDLLARDDLRQMDQRISRRLRLEPLDPGEVSAYVDRRLSVARADEGPDRLPKFTTSAMQAIATLSGGMPRVINTICDRALEQAWTAETDQIDAATVARAARSLNIDVPAGVRVRVSRRHARFVAAALGLGALVLWAVRMPAYRVLSERRAADLAVVQAPPAAPSAEPSPTAESTTDATLVPSTPPAPIAEPPSAAEPVALSAAPAVPAAPAPRADSPPGLTVTDEQAGEFLVVVSSFRTRDRATRAAEDVVGLGLPASTRSAAGWEQVVVGPYASREEAVAVQTRLATARMSDTKVAQRGQGRQAAPQPEAATPEPLDGPIDVLLKRASVLAQRSDVKTLQQIRDRIVERHDAEPDGATDASAFSSAIEQLDRYLAEARHRQLEQDAKQFLVDP